MRPEEKDRIKKLPAWAQDLILRQERDMAYLREKLEEERDLREGDVETNVLIDRYDREPTLLPVNSRVTFRVEGFESERPVNVSIKHSSRWGRLGAKQTLEVYSEDGTVLVSPQASNVVHVQVER